MKTNRKANGNTTSRGERKGTPKNAGNAWERLQETASKKTEAGSAWERCRERKGRNTEAGSAWERCRERLENCRERDQKGTRRGAQNRGGEQEGTRRGAPGTSGIKRESTQGRTAGTPGLAEKKQYPVANSGNGGSQSENRNPISHSKKTVSGHRIRFHTARTAEPKRKNTVTSSACTGPRNAPRGLCGWALPAESTKTLGHKKKHREGLGQLNSPFELWGRTTHLLSHKTNSLPS